MSAISQLAKTMREHARGAVEQHGAHGRYAAVVSLDPLSVVLEDGVTLTEPDDLSICQHVRWYDAQYGLTTADTLVVMPTQDGEWLAFAVISTTETPAI